MNEQSNDAADEQAGGPLAGERLAEARRLRQISLPDIARELHLDENKVQALEQNRFESLGAPVFAKGHLRKYAEIVGVPIDDVLADYYRLNRAAGAPPVVGRPRRRERDINLGPWLVGLPPVLVIIAAAYWWFGRTPGTEAEPAEPRVTRSAPAEPARVEPDPQPATPGPGDPAPAAAEPDPASGAVPPLPEPSVREAAADAPAASEAQPATGAAGADETVTPAPAGEIALALNYNGDCWTEVTDGNGRRLYFDLGRAGRTVAVSGPGPLTVLLGDAGNVAVSVNGEPYRVAAADRRGATARFTIAR